MQVTTATLPFPRCLTTPLSRHLSVLSVSVRCVRRISSFTPRDRDIPVTSFAVSTATCLSLSSYIETLTRPGVQSARSDLPTRQPLPNTARELRRQTLLNVERPDAVDISLTVSSALIQNKKNCVLNVRSSFLLAKQTSLCLRGQNFTCRR